MAAAGAQGLGWGLEQNGAAGVGADAAAAAVGAADEQLQYDPNMPCLIRKEPVVSGRANMVHAHTQAPVGIWRLPEPNPDMFRG